MAGKGATLAIKIVSDASKASIGFEQAESRAAKFEKGLDKASVAAAGVLAGVGALAKEAYEAASSLQQSSGAVESVFASEAQAIKDLAKEASKAVGLSTNSYQELASVLGAQLKGMGYAGEELTATTDSLVRTGADLAATFGGTTSEAVSALSSLLRGERDPIERYGIALSQAEVAARVAAMGLDASTPAAQRAAEAQAALALVAEKSASTQGAYAREADTAAGATQGAAAEYENAKASLGEVLLPVVSKAMEKFAELTEDVKENKDTVVPLTFAAAALALTVLAVNGAVAVASTVMTVWRGVMLAATAAQWLFNLAMSANPIGLIVLGIAALAYGIKLAYDKFEGFRNIVQSVWEWLKKAFDYAGKVAGMVGDWFGASSTPLPGAGYGSAPAPAPAVAGVYGAAAPGVYGASMSSLSGGRSTAGQGPTQSVTYQITVNGALDPVAVADQIGRIVDARQRRTGAAPAFGRVR